MDKVYYPRVRSILKPSPIPADILATNYYRFGRVAIDLAANAGLTGKLLEMNLDWDVIRQEIAGTRVASGIVGEFWYGNNSGGLLNCKAMFHTYQTLQLFSILLF